MNWIRCNSTNCFVHVITRAWLIMTLNSVHTRCHISWFAMVSCTVTEKSTSTKKHKYHSVISCIVTQNGILITASCFNILMSIWNGYHVYELPNTTVIRLFSVVLHHTRTHAHTRTLFEFESAEPWANKLSSWMSINYTARHHCAGCTRRRRWTEKFNAWYGHRFAKIHSSDIYLFCLGNPKITFNIDWQTILAIGLAVWECCWIFIVYIYRMTVINKIDSLMMFAELII